MNNTMIRRDDGKHILAAAVLLLRTAIAGVVLLCLAAGVGYGQSDGSASQQRIAHPNEPIAPFRVIGNIYYIGKRNTTSFLITTPAGHFLLDAGDATMAPLLRKNIEDLGFQLRDVKIILQVHAHSEHVGSLATMRELTGAQVMVMAQDAPALADGGKSDFSHGTPFTPVRADKLLHDEETVRLGGVTMVAHRTAGHTRGCTTWTTQAEENGRKYNVVFVCSNRVIDGVLLLNNDKYPSIADDFAKGFARLKGLPCDVFFASHGFMFNLDEKRKRLQEGTGPNPFIDPQGYRDYISFYEKAFLERLRQEKAGAGRE